MYLLRSGYFENLELVEGSDHSWFAGVGPGFS